METTKSNVVSVYIDYGPLKGSPPTGKCGYYRISP